MSEEKAIIKLAMPLMLKTRVESILCDENRKDCDPQLSPVPVAIEPPFLPIAYHRSMKNILLLENYYSPDGLENQIGLFVDYYNSHRCHEALNNLTLADVCYRKGPEILTKRQQIKKRTMLLRRK